MNIFELKNLPWSNGRYTVDNTSNVYDNGSLIQPSKIEENLFVKLDWVNGYKEYPLELIVVCSFNNVYYDRFFNLNLVDRIDVIFKDGTRNFFPGNLTFVFNGDPIEDPNKKGFYLIPNFPSYSIDVNGNVYSYQADLIKTWSTLIFSKESTKKSGYKYGNYYEDNGSKMCYQHRLLCLVFKKFSGVFKLLTVNHIDGDKTNNLLSNLEWLTYSENNKHAREEGLNNRGRRILVKNLLTEEIIAFKKIQDCASWLGENTRFYIYSRLKDRSNKVYPDYLSFKHDDGSEWPNYIIEAPNECFDVFNIAVLNVFTNEVLIFNNVREASSKLGIKTSIILEHCRIEKLLPTYGYNFRFLNRLISWPNHTRYHLEVYKHYTTNQPDGVFVFDHVENKELFFPSVEICIEHFSTTKGTIDGLVSTQRKLRKRYTFRKFNLKENLQMESISSETFL